MLFETAPAERRAAIAYLFQRELIYPIYRPERILVETDQGLEEALAFTVDREDAGYAGGLPEAAKAASVATGRGQAGRARDYLANALDRLEAMACPDPEHRRLLAEADSLPDEPARLFSLLDETARRRLDTIFQRGHK